MSTSTLSSLNNKQVQLALEMLRVNRRNEFKEIAQEIGVETRKNWEQIVLRFSLEINSCFVKWQDNENIKNNVRSCFIIMQKLVKDHKVSHAIKILDLTNKITEDFETIFKKMGRA
ncbi:MAG: hypothetical protein OEM77_02025 [Nitrosopumilus sp.]|nr:hypothetical protein [Nitrosopumilus sp.]MDH3737037.1 hypothetical protein [Nitrosopumilus sp.]MDH3823909.1 hypothetical protein [Nitrosopumilus sp.]MDH3834842.1 hypothetical protein [Nitrosopumilus sp.]